VREMERINHRSLPCNAVFQLYLQRSTLLRKWISNMCIYRLHFHTLSVGRRAPTKKIMVQRKQLMTRPWSLFHQMRDRSTCCVWFTALQTRLECDKPPYIEWFVRPSVGLQNFTVGQKKYFSIAQRNETVTI